MYMFVILSRLLISCHRSCECTLAKYVGVLSLRGGRGVAPLHSVVDTKYRVSDVMERCANGLERAC